MRKNQLLSKIGKIVCFLLKVAAAIALLYYGFIIVLFLALVGALVETDLGSNDSYRGHFHYNQYFDTSTGVTHIRPEYRGLGWKMYMESKKHRGW